MVDPVAPLASLRRRLLALVYEILLLAAVLFAVALVAVPASFLLDPLIRRPFLQCVLAGAAAIYFVWQWSRGGQTLAMKTWHLRLVSRDGTPLAPARAVARFAAALVGLAAAGTGFLWALVDRDRQFLHDRLAGTRIVFEEPAARARRS